MKSLFLPAAKWFSRRSIKTQILWLVLVVTLVGTVLISAASYKRHNDQTLTDSLQWSQALAALAAQASVGSLVDRDLPALETALQELVAMPGVTAVEVVQPQGLRLIRLSAEAGREPRIIYPGRHEVATPPGGPYALLDDKIHAYATILGSRSGADRSNDGYDDFLRHGWVELEFSIANRTAQAFRGWLVETVTSLSLIALSLTLFTLFLRRAFRPIGELALYSTKLASTPGERLHMRWGSREVRELGRNLNKSSEELALRIHETQQRLSRLRAILDTAVDAIVGVRMDGRIDSVSPAAEGMFGRWADAMPGLSLHDLLPGMDAPRLQKLIANGMLIHSTQSRIGQLETAALRQEGTSFPVELLVGEIPDDPDIRYTCIVRDLTDMKQAEEFLTLYGRVVDCTLNGITISNARRYPQPIVHANPAFCRITGYAPHELLGRDASILEGPLTDRDDLAALSQTVRKGGEATITLKNYRKDGSMFYNKLSVSPVRDAHGDITHYINVIEDVTAQVEVKQRLIERTARLNATFDLSPDGFAVFDRQGELISTNPAFRDMVGDIPSWCSLQRFDVWFKSLVEEGSHYRSISEAWNDKSTDIIAITQPTRKVLEREVRRNLGGSGETILYLRDVTHQTEVDRIKSEFLATAAHELRTPLASILGFTELMIHRKYSEEKQKDLLRTVHKQGTLLSNLIQELLDLSRIEARQGKDFHIVPTALLGIVRDVVDGIASFDAAREVTVGALPDSLVLADGSKIHQALTNLLSNAFKYSPKGGQVTLDAAIEEDAGTEMVAICIRDEGIGMSPDQLERAFERFYRADASGNIPGTGLGLNLVKEIADIHGGSVTLQSELGKGTIATLRLRLARGESNGTENREYSSQVLAS
ncbi:MAG TPA: PAS domain S-box protein [Hydrogenophaga sp.]|uniref:PAS domain S-box protein n=1 Tax=Hydrogenophaga sp. TaxID=1904254 RepID=UPI002BA02427|nr:PAS domain S-box protein [Hydrogenophaga sp.]HMN92700.1 PAS domain S-box protein [Hydrogenophaga sp.]